MKEYNKSIFIFRRDYRLEDNIGLLEALNKSISVIPIFIFTPEQLVNNKYKSNNCVQFMIESLDNLDDNLRKKGSKMYYFFGKPYKVIRKIINKMEIDAVFVNRDYTPYSKIRDESIQKICNKYNVNYQSFEDILLQPVGTIRNGSGEIYSKFTPFYNTGKKIKVPEIKKNNYTNYYSNKNKIHGEFEGDKHKFYIHNPNIAIHGGRENALKILTTIQKFKKYNDERNTLIKPTTRLSAYIKFGCVSIREVYHKIKEKLGMKNDLVKQLYWREFFYNVGDANTEKLQNKKNFKENYDNIKWITYKTATDEQKKQWTAWIEGKTGFPIQDAGIRQLITTGYMENRARLISGSFLIKDMFWSPFEGEKFFSNYLIDLDRNVNINNWLWLSGGGTDTMPYFRVFSPYQQSIKSDPNCEYIKQWIPELKNVPNEHIQKWNEYYDQYPNVKYPKPILDHSSNVKKTLEKYKKALYK